MALAFELPEHLPRSNKSQDKSTSILTKIGQASHRTLNADLATSWLAELDATIQETKSRISIRVHDDLPAFERQLKSSISVRSRLHALSSDVNELAESLNGPNIGILPTLLRKLSTHGTLVEQTNDSEITHRALGHLLRLQEELRALSVWVEQEKLPQSADACRRVQGLLAEAPSPLNRAEIMSEIKKRHRTLNDRVQEQLGNAYSRSIAFCSSSDTISLTIHASTRDPQTTTEITLPDVLRCLTSDTLSTRLSMLRRDIMSKFVEPVLLSTRSLTSLTNEATKTLTLTPTSSSPLQSLQTLSTFLHANIFPHLPPTHATYPSTFHAPITTAILTHFLKSSIPSCLSLLPPFLNTVDEAVRFEEELSPSNTRDRPIRYWADDIAGHYERKRREDVLQHARQVITNQVDDATVRTEVVLKRSQDSPVSSSEGQGDTHDFGWDFDVETTHEEKTGVWSKDAEENSSDGEVPSDGWGWGDDTDGDNSPSLANHQEETSSSNAEDDPWGTDGWGAAQTPTPLPEPELTPLVSHSAPKLAKRLEKLSAKAKGFSAPNTPVASPSIAATPKLSSTPAQPQAPRGWPSPSRKKLDKEAYLVSVRAKTVLQIAEDLVQEGQELMRSNTLSEHLSPKNAVPGHLLVAAAPRVLDLHRALYPVVHSPVLAGDTNMAMRWANDCRYLSEEVVRLRNKGHVPSVEDPWAETEERLRVLGETWFEDVVVRQQNVVKDVLIDAQGFIEVANVERFEECKSTIQRVLSEITSVAQQWKMTLTRNSYLYAIGKIVDDALFRVMDDILCLEDIPEADSERLSELCEILTPLEDLFADTPGEQSVVGSHVPLWFKFSYLSWLIKGSIADISYLFDQGMLVDYEIDELVRLLRALFAETPLRENTIAKISKGHPVTVQRDDF